MNIRKKPFIQNFSTYLTAKNGFCYMKTTKKSDYFAHMGKYLLILVRVYDISCL